MQRIIVTMMFIVLGIAGPLLAQQTTGNISGRLVDAQGSAVPGVTVTAKNPSDRLDSHRDERRRRRLPPDRAARRRLRRHRRAPGLQQGGRTKGIVVNVGQTLDVNMTLKVASSSETVTVTGETPLIETTLVVGRRRRRHQADREPAAQRPSVREPRGDDSGRRPRLPHRPDQEHAVRAADQRRRRPQRQLPDRRRRQQRRHRRRPAAAVSARSDPGVQLP